VVGGVVVAVAGEDEAGLSVGGVAGLVKSISYATSPNRAVLDKRILCRFTHHRNYFINDGRRMMAIVNNLDCSMRIGHECEEAMGLAEACAAYDGIADH